MSETGEPQVPGGPAPGGGVLREACLLRQLFGSGLWLRGRATLARFHSWPRLSTLLSPLLSPLLTLRRRKPAAGLAAWPFARAPRGATPAAAPGPGEAAAAGVATPATGACRTACRSICAAGSSSSSPELAVQGLHELRLRALSWSAPPSPPSLESLRLQWFPPRAGDTVRGLVDPRSARAGAESAPTGDGSTLLPEASTFTAGSICRRRLASLLPGAADAVSERQLQRESAGSCLGAVSAGAGEGEGAD